MEVFTVVTLHLPGTRLITEEYFGSIDFATNGSNTVMDTALDFPFSKVVQDYFNQRETATSPYFCNGTCLGAVYAPGINYTCTDTMSYHPIRVPGLGFNGFSISSHRYTTKYPGGTVISTLELTAEHVDLTDASCSAVLVTTKCIIHSGTVYYPIAITNTTVRRDYSRNISNFELHVNAGDAATSGTNGPVYAGPLAALNWVIKQYY